MKSTIKGGVWKNTEDEILKVAVMKYGKNQWARISSLLVRKSPAQCKARWYEWLDPSIKKTEWSKEEEEKLLHLAKIFPAQWKTIAPLVGRTASQCLEHYNRLLDQVQARESMSEDDPRRLRVGEVEANPETKPAKPDPIDMDEDEKETLSEAKARLSNTQGKKEKRKFREKQLEEARRLAHLQKKRELKAAGIIVHDKKKKDKDKRFDYSQEIPFYHKPMPGFYDTTEEDKQLLDPNKDKQFINQRLDKIDGESKADQIERANKLEELRKKRRDMANLPEAIKQINKMNDPEMTRKRNKMVLPEPQLTDDDLQEIAEFEKNNKPTFNNSNNNELTATATLVGGLMRPPTEIPNRANMVARTPMKEDIVMMEAQNLLAMSTAQTPLKGGANPTLHPSDFSSVTPKPVSLKTPLRTPNPLAQGITPRTNNNNNISKYHRDEYDDSAISTKHLISNGLKNLPTPVNKYQISLPDEPTLEDIDEQDQLELDQSEKEIREIQELKHKEQFRLRNRSLPLKKSLPRAQSLPTTKSNNTLKLLVKSNDDDSSLNELENQIRNLMINEISSIISHDDRCYPIQGGTNDDPNFEIFTEKELKDAQSLLNLELQQLQQQQQQQQQEEEDKSDTLNQFVNIWNTVKNNYIYKNNQYLERSSISKEQEIESLEEEYNVIVNSMKGNAKKAFQMEKKLTTDLSSQQTQLASLLSQIEQLNQQIEQSSIELECFKQLRIIEQRAIETRVKLAQNQVYDLCDRENRNQMKYANLLHERNSLLNKN